MKYSTIQDIVHDLENNPVERGGNIYHPIPFTEFEHLKTSTNPEESSKRLHLIKGLLMSLYPNGLQDLKILDIGANAGYFTFSLAKEGAEITTFEPHERYAPIGQFLAKEKENKVQWNGIAFNLNMVVNQHFDLTLMLSVFQWMANGGSRFNKAAEELFAISKISTHLVFELGFNQGKSCIVTKKKNHYAELVSFLKRHTTYTRFKLLGKTRAWGRGHRRYMILCSDDKDFDDNPYRSIIRSVRI